MLNVPPMTIDDGLVLKCQHLEVGEWLAGKARWEVLG